MVLYGAVLMHMSTLTSRVSLSYSLSLTSTVDMSLFDLKVLSKSDTVFSPVSFPLFPPALFFVLPLLSASLEAVDADEGMTAFSKYSMVK